MGSVLPGGVTLTSVGEAKTATTKFVPGDIVYDAPSGAKVKLEFTMVVAPAVAIQPFVASYTAR
jgi:hypothetical protein